MIASIELQVISKILTSDDESLVEELCGYDTSYYSVFKPQISYILEHKSKYGNVPDLFTFKVQYPDVELVVVNESIEFLRTQLRKNKQHILLMETFNKIKDLGSDDVAEAWQYLSKQCDVAEQLSEFSPLDIIKDAQKRADQVSEYSKQSRIPTGFAEIDRLMYGGLSTVEELVILLARTNTGKSWVCTKMMEAAQKAGFPVAYYSPEMQGAYLATRFDTWRAHHQNSSLYRGIYSAAYLQYLKDLAKEDTSAYIIEDKDAPDGVSVKKIEAFIKLKKIKLLIVDGLSYMMDDEKSKTDYDKFQHICRDLFRLSKKYGCAIVVAVQANRETKESKDEKGVPFPNMYNIEGSDHPARIATQVFSLRQVFEKHVLDIRLEKTRMANNENPVLSYSWDVNTGNMQYLENGDTPANATISMPDSADILADLPMHSESDMNVMLGLTDDDDNVEF